MADSTVLYPSLPQGSSDYRVYDKNYFRICSDVWPVTTCKTIPTFHPYPECTCVCGAWWDHLSDRYPISESGRCERIKTDNREKLEMKKIRNIDIDFIKVIACIGVVLLHTTMPGFKETRIWNYSSYLYYLGTYSIPLFFMVNGYLLLGKSEIKYSYILEKIKWILITVCSWNLIIWLLKRDFTANPVKKIAASLIQKGYFFQFWFFGSLILIYLCLPILKKILHSKRSYLYILSLLVVIGLIFELVNFLLQMPVQTYVIQTFRLWTWFFYYILGGLVAQFEIDNLKYIFKGWMKVVSMLLLLISPMILFFMAKTIYHNLFAEYFYDILLVKVISLGLFLTLLTLTIDSNKYKIIYFLSVQTMGVFIIHTYVMQIWQKFIGFNIVGAYLFFPIFTLIISFIIIMILMRIPYINRIVKL